MADSKQWGFGEVGAGLTTTIECKKSDCYEMLHMLIKSKKMRRMGLGTD